MCYNSFVRSARFHPAFPAMPVRHAVTLIAPEGDVCLPPATPLESTLVEVFILNTLNLFRMNADYGRPHFAQFLCNVNPFRINTCKSVSKQTTLSLFRINPYENQAAPGCGFRLSFALT